MLGLENLGLEEWKIMHAAYVSYVRRASELRASCERATFGV